jgi:hypothetical protein
MSHILVLKHESSKTERERECGFGCFHDRDAFQHNQLLCAPTRFAIFTYLMNNSFTLVNPYIFHTLFDLLQHHNFTTMTKLPEKCSCFICFGDVTYITEH